VLSGFFSGNNVSFNSQVLQGWFSGDATDRNNQQVITGWFSGGNVSQNIQVLQGWFSGNNISTNLQIIQGWFSGDNTSTRIYEQVITGWFSGGNATPFPITITDEYPTDTSTNIPPQPTIYITINHSTGDTMNISWYYGLSLGNETILLGTENNINNGTFTELFYPAINRTTSYYWRVQADDGTNYLNETYSFTTEGYPTVPMPTNIGLAIIGIIFGTLGILSFFMISNKRRKRRRDMNDYYIYEEVIDEWQD